MASYTTTIRLDETEKEAFSQMAEFEGVGLSSLLKEAMWEKYEDWRDVRLYKDYLKRRERLGDKYKTISHAEMMREFAHEGK